MSKTKQSRARAKSDQKGRWKPTDVRGAWKPEPALRRVRRCLGLLRSGDFISPSEQGRINRRVVKWRKRHLLRQVSKSRVAFASSKPSAMRDTISERFRAFHAANPAVYRHLVRLTETLYKRGRERIGIRCLWEQIRWHIALGIIRVRGEYMLNDQYTSRYVRMLIADNPAFKNLFETRVLRAL